MQRKQLPLYYIY